MGIVKVKVLGTIRHGELIYASSLKPGVALPRGYMQLLRKPNQPPILLGKFTRSVYMISARKPIAGFHQ